LNVKFSQILLDANESCNLAIKAMALIDEVYCEISIKEQHILYLRDYCCLDKRDMRKMLHKKLDSIRIYGLDDDFNTIDESSVLTDKDIEAISSLNSIFYNLQNDVMRKHDGIENRLNVKKVNGIISNFELDVKVRYFATRLGTYWDGLTNPFAMFRIALEDKIEDDWNDTRHNESSIFKIRHSYALHDIISHIKIPLYVIPFIDVIVWQYETQEEHRLVCIHDNRI
jgi:hypothetical protein